MLSAARRSRAESKHPYPTGNACPEGLPSWPFVSFVVQAFAVLIADSRMERGLESNGSTIR